MAKVENEPTLEDRFEKSVRSSSNGIGALNGYHEKQWGSGAIYKGYWKDSLFHG